MARLTLIAARFARQDVAITYSTCNEITETRRSTRRLTTITDLPVPFWCQQGVGIVALAVACWVMSFKHGDLGARTFALTGAFLTMSAMAAAVYSTHRIALPEDHFRVLSTINHISAANVASFWWVYS